MLTHLIISAIEPALTYLVSHQLTDHEQWHDLYGQPILLRLENPEIKVFCIISEKKIHIRKAKDDDIVTVSITTDVNTLLAMCRGQRLKRKITIQGQTALATLLSRYIKSFQPNYEGMLATVIGESSAYAVVTQIQHASDTLEKNVDNFYQSSGDYIQHEYQLAPSRLELKKFYREVDQIAAGTDLLEQKIKTYDEGKK